MASLVASGVTCTAVARQPVLTVTQFMSTPCLRDKPMQHSRAYADKCWHAADVA